MGTTCMFNCKVNVEKSDILGETLYTISGADARRFRKVFDAWDLPLDTLDEHSYNVSKTSIENHFDFKTSHTLRQLSKGLAGATRDRELDPW